MSEYSQPDFYRFNEDSFRLVKWVKSHLNSAESILDFGAGSGVIGIELARHFLPRELMLLEIQEEFREHLETNVKTFLPEEVKSQILTMPFSTFNPKNQFDLIAINPPYYLPGRGELPVNMNRAIARSFIHDSWNVLANKIHLSLKPAGHCYIVLKKDDFLYEEIKRNVASFPLSLERTIDHSLMFLRLLRLDKN